MPGNMDMTYYIVVNAYASFPTLKMLVNALWIATQIHRASKSMFGGVAVGCNGPRTIG